MTQLILITGVSQGLGLAMTEGFAQAGHTVIGCARSPRAIEKLQQRFGSPHNFAAIDVAHEPQVEAWAKRLLATYGTPDLLINNAAIINTLAPLWAVPSADFSMLIDINIKGVANVIRQFVPAMVAKQHGIVVNLSSGWGRSTSPHVASYCASKWAIESLTRALAQELPPGMAAIPLSPGIVHTEMLEACYSSDAANFITPQDWAVNAIPFLLNLKPEHNGQPLTVPS